MDFTPITITRDGLTRSFGYDLVCSGYLVEDGRVLLVRHSLFGRWVPPGGHIEPGETFAEAACREFLEETGLRVEAISVYGMEFNDSNASTQPLPFHVDVLLEGFQRPALTQYFFVRRTPDSPHAIRFQDVEVTAADWFTAEQLADIATFDQVKALARFAIENHPSALSQ